MTTTLFTTSDSENLGFWYEGTATSSMKRPASLSK